MNNEKITAEDKRLEDNAAHKVFWKKWGPYLSERQWGTVREDYSEDGDAWGYFPHDYARSRVYRWGEDGLAGISDTHQNICFALALWNGKDSFLKERLFGLNPREGNHGEDVKELYYYLDNTPTHSYMKMLYKYPQGKFPYEELVEVNRNRSRLETEYELLDTGIFDQNRYFDIFVEYAKADPEDILIKIEIFNRSHENADITVLPTLWFRNTWVSGKVKTKPVIRLMDRTAGMDIVKAVHEQSGTYYLHAEKSERALFTENETNAERLFHVPNPSAFVKDLFHQAVTRNAYDLLQGKRSGTKCAFLYQYAIPGGGSRTIRLRLSNRTLGSAFNPRFDEVFSQRIAEADEFFSQFLPDDPVSDVSLVQRRGFAGLLWSKQYYNYEIETWLKGDDGMPPPPQKRRQGRNHEWRYLFNRDILSMPDTWEYPWYAAWDLAFHCVPLAMIDPDFAKKQLILLLREWYMRPNGQIPAYEWNFNNVNPPVHAWAALKVYAIEKKRTGKGDISFLKRVFHKLLLNFTWWVNKKDLGGRNIFQGGFLGLDNIGIFDRSIPLPGGGHIEQADGTSWMAMYSLNLMDMALEIAQEDPTYEDVASKFFEHFIHIAESLNAIGEQGLWHEEDGFYYDALHFPASPPQHLRVRSLVGLTPLFAVSVLKRSVLDSLHGFRKRLLWFTKNRKDLGKHLVIEELTEGEDVLLSLTPRRKLIRLLKRMFDEREFLSPGGIRSISKHHMDNPFVLTVTGTEFRVEYEPGESLTTLYGGNSNWRGPIWVPMNYLFIEALKKYYLYYWDKLKVEFPTGSGNFFDLWEVSKKISQRITGIFIQDNQGKRLVHGDGELYWKDPHFRDLVLFYEYFHADTCRGLGASHQTGWTGLIAEMIEWCWCLE